MSLENLTYFLKWLFISLLIGAVVGSSSSVFLHSLDWITNYREKNLNLIFLLPIGGFLIGLLYHYYGKSIEKGNLLIIENFGTSHQKTPFLMGIFIYLGTLATHLFGGSAGREGTAVQMAGAFVSPFNSILKLNKDENQTLLMAAIAAGFGSVFGTPLAGIIFAFEFFRVGWKYSKNIFPIFLSTFFAHYIAQLWQVKHSIYTIEYIPDISFSTIFYTIIAGILFGICAALFNFLLQKSTLFFKKNISYAPLRPLFGGIILLLFILIIQEYSYTGLGLSSILKSFQEPSAWYVFLLKIAFTIVTLASGFKGGEATPLFFIGATLGSTLSIFIPLPFALLAGLGFISVFAGAAKTPFTCVLLAIELFGFSCLPYASIVCLFSFLFSGKQSIYYPLNKKLTFFNFPKSN